MANEKNCSKLDSSKSIKKKPKSLVTRQTITKFLFDEVIYCVGDYLMLRETNKTVAVAQLVKIVPEVL